MKIYKIKVNGKTYKVELESVTEVASEKVVEAKKEEAPKQVSSGEGKAVNAPIQGSVVNVKVKPGDKVSKGTVLLVIEAMKLENDVVSPFDGVVAEVLVSKGQNVTTKDVVVTIK